MDGRLSTERDQDAPTLGVPLARATPDITDALDQYLLTRTHCAVNTQINDTSVLRRFVAFFDTIQVGHLTPLHVERFFFQKDGQAQAMRPSSYNKVLQRVRGFFKFCASRGWIRVDLLANVRPRRPFQRERLRLTPHQLLSLLETTSCPRNRCMLAVGMNLALRASELTALKLADVDLANGLLHVSVTKSGTDDLMPISSDLDVELRRWMTSYTESSMRFKGFVLSPEHYLFPAQESSRLGRREDGQQVRRPGPWKPEVRQSHPARVVQKALLGIGIEIEPGEGFHTLRRSAGRAFFDSVVREGHDQALRMTSAYLHHASTVTTEGYLGLRHEKVLRDQVLKGRPFLSALSPAADVIPLRPSSKRARS